MVVAALTAALGAQPPEQNPENLCFEPNRGQFSSIGVYGAGRRAWTALLGESRLVVRMRRLIGDPSAGVTARSKQKLRNLELTFVGAARVRPDGEDRRNDRSDYFWGDDPAKWMRNVPHFSRVRYRGLWPGVDAIVSGDSSTVEIRPVLTPQADPGVVVVHSKGAVALGKDTNGGARIVTPWGAVRLRPPSRANGAVAASGSYRLRDDGALQFIRSTSTAD